MHPAEINNHILSFSFFLIFCAYYNTQNFASTLDPTHGPIALGLSYFVWIITLLTIASPITASMRPKYATLIGAVTYTMYISSGININNIYLLILYYFGSLAAAFGAGPLWLGQSIIVVQCSNEYESTNRLITNSKLGTFNGIFNLYLCMARFMGNLGAALIFHYNGSVQTMQITMVSISIVGGLMLLLIKSNYTKPSPELTQMSSITSMSMETRRTTALSSNAPSSPPEFKLEYSSPDAKTTNTHSILKDMKDIVHLWKNKLFLRLIPISLAWGFTSGFIATDIGGLIDDHSFKFYVLAIEGFVSGLSSIVLGLLSDKIHGFYFIFLSCAAFDSVLVFMYFWTIDQNATLEWYIIAVILGIGDGGFFTLIPQSYPILLGSTNAVFANLRICLAVSATISYVMYPFWSFEGRLLVNVVIVTVGALCLVMSPNARRSRASTYHRARNSRNVVLGTETNTRNTLYVDYGTEGTVDKNSRTDTDHDPVVNTLKIVDFIMSTDDIIDTEDPFDIEIPSIIADDGPPRLSALVSDVENNVHLDGLPVDLEGIDIGGLELIDPHKQTPMGPQIEPKREIEPNAVHDPRKYVYL